jgi:hypothetical protein
MREGEAAASSRGADGLSRLPGDAAVDGKNTRDALVDAVRDFGPDVVVLELEPGAGDSATLPLDTVLRVARGRLLLVRIP